ncbi:hypothetical protein OAF14_01525 [Akkermansiaceae bacterium]|nr:hypothetical protein [Akkermansiaceae bacterium]
MKRYIIILAWKIKGLDVYSLYLKLLKREPWSEKQWKEYQNKRFLEFVRYCYENSAYYKELFDSKNLKLQDIKSLDDIKLIPVLTKEIVRENINKIVVKKGLKKKFIGHTTGSTGVPLTYYGSANRSKSIVAGLWRYYARCGWVPGDQIASIWGFKNKETSSYKEKLRNYFSGITHFNAWEANDADFEDWFETLRKKRIRILVCYGSSGSRFASWMLHNNKKYDGLKGVFSTSERLYEHQKKLMNDAFLCPIFDIYGCGEVTHLACSCRMGKMHLTQDMSIVEVGEPNENQLLPLIVTGFENLSTPFLRYQNGDCGSLSDEKCNCGLNTPLMELTVSRLSDVFKFSDGKKYPSLYFVLRLYKGGFNGIELFQFHQDSINHIFLRIIKNKRFSEVTHNNLLSVIEEISEHINHMAVIEIVYQEHIEQSTSSKHYYARSDVK